jgi:uncharacterized membrane protein YfcA
LIYLMSAGVLKKLLPLAILLAAAYLAWPRRSASATTPSKPPLPPLPFGAASN